MQLDHSVLMQVLQNLIEIAVVVINNQPSESESWEAIDLRNCAGTNDRDILG